MRFTLQLQPFWKRPINDLRLLKTLSVMALLLFSCAERERNSVFDPQSEVKTLEIGFVVSSRDSLVIARWNRPSSQDFEGFNLYRQGPSETAHTLYRQLPKTADTFEETVETNDGRYSYYITLRGNNIESVPTETLAVIPGPGDIWLSDWAQWEVSNISYDLSGIRLRHSTAWLPLNLAFNDSLILVTHPQVNYLEIFRQQDASIVAGVNDLAAPYDAIFEPRNNTFWVTDSSGSLFEVTIDGRQRRLVEQGLQQPTEIERLDSEHIYVLEKKSGNIAVYNHIPARVDAINLGLTNPIGMRIDRQSGLLWILDRSDADRLYKVDPIQKSVALFYEASYISAFSAGGAQNSVWVALLSGQNAEIVQLSETATRLQSRGGFSEPTDLRVNPYNGHLFVADPVAEKIYHFRPDLSELGSAKTRGAIVRLYIE